MDKIIPFSTTRSDQPTPREQEILNYIWAGLTSQEIAARLQIAQKTLAIASCQLAEKVPVTNAAQLLRLALLEGLLSVPSAEYAPATKREAQSQKTSRRLTSIK